MNREEAIKILRETHDKSEFSVCNALETLAPELRESEDERIRKELWEYFHELELSSDRDFSPSFTIDDILAWLEKQKEQQPAEWSKEDELMRKRCIVDLGYLTEYEPQYKERYDAQINWLKSLRPKRVNVSDQTLQLLICYLYACHDVAKRGWEKDDCRRYISYLEDLDYTLKNSWKPSEEQLDALREASVGWMNEEMGNAKILESLYEQLKAL